MTTTTLEAKSRTAADSRSRIVAWSLVGVALTYLIFGLPYSAGYGDRRFTIAWWLKTYWADPTWSHGALAPLVAGFLVWRKREVLSSIEPKPSVSGLLIALISLAIFWIGYRGNFYFIGFASLHVLLGAAVVWLWGWRHFMLVSFAWLMLSFTWPYLFLVDTLAFQLRYLMVSVTHWLLNHVGVATLQEGTRLISAAAGDHAQGAAFDLNIDGPCSGLRSLFALMMVSALFGYFRQRSTWRRALLFALSIPLAVLANMVRILILVFGSMAFGQTFAVGKGEEYTSNFHLLAGIFVFIIALGGLLLGERFLNKTCGRERPLPIWDN